ncbi:trehalase-domain-containing protein [Xylaria sp. FL1042]|nr:trehalase-domain-containing protein [Xylaria sp. FL1042]
MAALENPLRRRYSNLELQTRGIERDAYGKSSHGSQDDLQIALAQPFLVVDVLDTLTRLIAREDTNGDHHITIEDKGPKMISLGTLNSGGYLRSCVYGHRAVSNMLEELTSSLEKGNRVGVINGAILYENPLERIQRYIKERFWVSLTRRLDAEVIELAVKDTKIPGWSGTPIIYVPYGAEKQLAYYNAIASQRPALDLHVISLPPEIPTDVYWDILKNPGILALDTEEYVDEATGLKESRAVPFVVPGGRFNEFFGWDSYFMGLGLLHDGRPDLVAGILRNWVFEIQHYGLIPNANRSYLMQRSQPPFLTDLSLRFFEYGATKATTTSSFPSSPSSAKSLLHLCIQAAIKEYHNVWTCPPRLNPGTGLSKYCPVGGFGIPSEVEPGHFDNVLRPFAATRGLTIAEFTDLFNAGSIEEPALEEYLQHDRAVRESGHDTSTRLDGRAANLAITDLNFCLYKYETDIARAIEDVFGGTLDIDPAFRLPSSPDDSSADTWRRRASMRRDAVDRYLWDENRGSYFDYDVTTGRQLSFESVTCLWALWSGIASPHQAELVVSRALPKFEFRGGLATSSAATVRTGSGGGGASSHGHQWDYPYGWAPHQMLAWDGLARYGYRAEAARLAYRWLYTILKVFVDYNGAVCEKYDMIRVKDPHKVDVEYGNQGVEFVGYPREGFGWTNASFVCGLEFLSDPMRRALAVCAPWDSVSKIGQVSSLGESYKAAEALEDNIPRQFSDADKNERESLLEMINQKLPN